MDWCKSTISHYATSFRSLLHLNSRPSVLYQITTAPNTSALLAVLSQSSEVIVLDNIALSHLRIRASYFLTGQLLPVLQRLESCVVKNRSQSQAIRQRTIVMRIPALVEAERLDSSANVAQGLQDFLNSFVGFHVQLTGEIQYSLRSNRSGELAHSIVTSCRQAEVLFKTVQSSKNLSELYHSLEEMLHDFSGSHNASHRGHAGPVFDQFWSQGEAGKDHDGNNACITLLAIEKELVRLKQLKSRLEGLLDQELSTPSAMTRHPFRYAGLTCLAGYATNLATAHSRVLGGNGQLEEGIIEKVKALKLFAVVNAWEPAWQLYEQIFVASPLAANKESVAASKSAVRDLLVDFTNKHLRHVPGALEQAENGSMKAMVELIRTQAGKPVRSFLQGSLAQALLIQIQKLKSDVEELMVKTKQTLRAQELNLALLALIPSLLSGAAIVYLLSTFSFYWRNRGRDVIISTRQTAKFLLADIQSSLLSLDHETTQARESEKMSYLIWYARHVGLIHGKVRELNHLVCHGSIRAPPKVLFRFKNDLDLLQEAESIKVKRGHIERILCCYTFLMDR